MPVRKNRTISATYNVHKIGTKQEFPSTTKKIFTSKDICVGHKNSAKSLSVNMAGNGTTFYPIRNQL